jgi:hypothetical protein
LECFAENIAAPLGRGEGRGRPVDDGESGGCFDLVDHLPQGAVTAVVEDPVAAARLPWPGIWVISSSRLSAPLRMVTARIAGDSCAGRFQWPMPVNWL